jgi:hypothetical protein
MFQKLKSSIRVPLVSVCAGFVAYLTLSGILLSGFSPLRAVVEATGYGSFSYVTNLVSYEFTEVSYNMEDMYNSTHLYDFSNNRHFGRVEGSLEFTNGFFGRSLQWLNGYIVSEDLNMVDISFTVEAWIYPTSPERLALAATLGTVYPHIIWKWENGSMAYQYSGLPNVLYSNKSVGLNSWTHVALVYNAVTNVATWYLNGSAQGSKEVLAGRDWDGKWLIGRFDPDRTTFEWRGMIDEFRIYRGRVLTQSKIREDMITSIGCKLLVYGLTPNSDVVQLWYPNGEFARARMLEQAADADGKVEFNVYSFSGGSETFKGILKVVSFGRTFSSPLLELSWGDVYFFSVQPLLTETQMALLVAVLAAVVPSALMLIRRYFHRRHKAS